MSPIFIKEALKEICRESIKPLWTGTPDCLPYCLSPVDRKTKARNEAWITEKTEILTKQMKRLSSGRVRNRKLLSETESLLREALLTEPVAGVGRCMDADTLNAFEEKLKELLLRIRSFDRSLGFADMGQALRNYLVYAIFRELNGLPQECSSSIFGYSMLYPYTDNFLDDPSHTPADKKRYNELIRNQITGNHPIPATGHEQMTCRLLEAVESDYGQKEYADLQNGLLLMLDAQQESLRQQSSCSQIPPSEEEVLDISIYKGGLSVLIDRWLADRSFTREDLVFYMSFGFILQLSDDLQDISEDLQNGGSTLPTCVCREGDAVRADRLVNKLINFTAGCFRSYRAPNPAYSDFLLNNTYLLILSSAFGSGSHFSPGYLKELESFMPVSQEYLDTTRRRVSSGELAGKEEKFLAILDDYLASSI